MLRRGKDFLQSLDCYTARFQKQERVSGELLDEQTMAMKCRHAPFSIFLVWHTGDVGREVLYVDGQNDNKLIAHDGGWKARLPAFSLAPDSTLAMRDARHPVTAAGLLKLIETMLEVHETDLRHRNYSTCDVVADQFFDGHRCLAFTTTYKSANDSPVYRKSMTLLDTETGLPVHTQHFGWPGAGTSIGAEQLDEATLVESYSYTDLRFECQLTDHDFDQRNQEYHFR